MRFVCLKRRKKLNTHEPHFLESLVQEEDAGAGADVPHGMATPVSDVVTGDLVDDPDSDPNEPEPEG